MTMVILQFYNGDFYFSVGLSLIVLFCFVCALF